MLFCDTFTLLRFYQAQALLPGITHVILDGIDDRTIDMDLLLSLFGSLVERFGDISC
jgi:HrpA-like RNA helicase